MIRSCLGARLAFVSLTSLIASSAALALAEGDRPKAVSPAGFVNRVWEVAESPAVAKGQLYVFLSEGTLVIASAHGTPALGKWKIEDGGLVMVEEGIARKVDVVAGADELRLRIHGVREPLDMRLVPAGATETADESLVGTAWRLESLGGDTALAGVEATLEFAEPGNVAGRASCNRFFGSVEIGRATIRFGAIGSTRMTCPDSVSAQESRYLEALQNATRFERSGATLAIFFAGSDRPLGFVLVAAGS